NVVTDALIHLLPKVHMMGIKRVVEIKDPGLDMAKRAGLADGGGAHCTVWPAVMPRSGRSKARSRRPATAAIPAIMRKNIILSMPLHRLPSQPASRLPAKLVANHNPMSIDTICAGASFETSESPMGEM